MTDKTYGTTTSGRLINDELIKQLCAAAENGHDIEQILEDRRARVEPHSER